MGVNHSIGREYLAFHLGLLSSYVSSMPSCPFRFRQMTP